MEPRYQCFGHFKSYNFRDNKNNLMIETNSRLKLDHRTITEAAQKPDCDYFCCIQWALSDCLPVEVTVGCTSCWFLIHWHIMTSKRSLAALKTYLAGTWRVIIVLSTLIRGCWNVDSKVDTPVQFKKFLEKLFINNNVIYDADSLGSAVISIQ